MICTNNKSNNRMRLLCAVCGAALLLGGCGSAEKEVIEQPYRVYSSAVSSFPELEGSSTAEGDFFAKNLCVTEDIDFGEDQLQYTGIAEGAGVFNLDTKEVTYSQNHFGRLYPASTTKILTAYIILQDADLDDTTTVSETIRSLDPASSVCGLRVGDTISIRDLLYGLMLVSGNDAAVALAEYYSGSVEAFAEVMNREALKLGASQSHFVNPHGLPDDNHYTTVYDMYLLFSAAVQLDDFVTVIGTQQWDASYTNADGDPVSQTWWNTNQYLAGKRPVPENITVIGGKTGTTFEAGYCLCLYSLNARNERIISIVLKADGRSDLYLMTEQILNGFAN